MCIPITFIFIQMVYDSPLPVFKSTITTVKMERKNLFINMVIIDTQ